MHTHYHNHSHGEGSSSKNLKVAFFLNLTFTFVELVGGVYTNSVAILSDAIHDLGDSIALGISWYLENYSNKKIDAKYSFGYKRFSLLGAVLNSVILIVGAVFMMMETVPRLFDPPAPDSQGMMFLAALGVFVNGLAVFRLKKGNTLNEKAVMLHLLEDALGWVAVLIGSILIYFFELPILDPILSLLITFVIVKNVYVNLKKTSVIFLQSVPENVDVNSIKKSLEELSNVNDVHDIHVWSMDGAFNVMSLHVEVNHTLTFEQVIDVKEEVKDFLLNEGIQHVTIEVEIPKENKEIKE